MAARKDRHILNLNLTGEWFDAILDGTKTREYRRVCPHWNVRLANLERPSIVVFRRGYTNDKMAYELLSWRVVPKSEMTAAEQAAVAGEHVWALELGEQLW